MYYRNDGTGFLSKDTGFFAMFKQGSINYTDFTLNEAEENREIDIEELKNDKDIIYLRNIKECELLKSKINISKNILIIGGGFIGLEVASSIKAKHNNVNIIEIGKSLMGRIIPKKISDLIDKELKKI